MKERKNDASKPKKDKIIKEKLDIRIKHLIDNGVKHGHRTLFILAGPKAKKQVVILHHMLRKSRKSAPDNSMLWCYESKDFEIPRFQKKRRKMMDWNQNSNMSGRNDDFNLFLASTKIRFCFYKEVSNILGNTFEALVLQHFDSLTPNILGQTVETVRGGGLVIFLLESIESLDTLRFAVNFGNNPREFSSDQPRPRFNQRLLRSLSICNMAMMITDELMILDDVLKMEILPHVRNLEPSEEVLEEDFKSEKHELLLQLQDSYTDQVMKQLMLCCKTFDQASVVVKLAEAIGERASHKTFTVTAARGRGKSSALGLAIAFALKKNYSNILVTSPSPENLVTFFEFVGRGLEAFGYKNKKHFLIERSTDIKVNKSVIKIEVIKKHKQVVEYIHPSDCSKLTFAEILVIDEAAAIPLSYIKNLMGPYMTFMSSTLHGYEGTGQTLARKFFKDLKEDNVLAQRTLEGLQLSETIRYKSADPVESWLNQLLILNSSTRKIQPSVRDALSADDCSLYCINRESLFQFKKKPEKLLSEFVAIYTASNYKHSPDDLKIMSDSAGHQLFCLLSPPGSNGTDRKIICVLHVCFEGKLVKDQLSSEMNEGKITKNNTISYQLAMEFRQYNINLNELGALRIVHIATHPDLQGRGFGSHAIGLLENYLRNVSLDLKEELFTKSLLRDTASHPSTVAVQYLNANFDLNQRLLQFWQKGGFVPLVIDHTADDLTGDNTCISVKSIAEPSRWVSVFWSCFYKGMLNLLPGIFNSLHPKLALSLLCRSFKLHQPLTQDLLKTMYGRAIWDIVCIHSTTPLHLQCLKPSMKMLAMAFFEVLDNDLLLPEESLVLLALALQNKQIEVVAEELKVTSLEVEHHFSKAFCKIKAALVDLMGAISIHELPQAEELPSQNKQPQSNAISGDWASYKANLKKKVSKFNFAEEITFLLSTCISSGQKALIIIRGQNYSRLPLLVKYYEGLKKEKLKVLWYTAAELDSQLKLFLQSYQGSSFEDPQTYKGDKCDVVIASNMEEMLPGQLANCNHLLKNSGLLLLLTSNKEVEANQSSLFVRRFHSLLPSLKNSLELTSKLEVLSHALLENARPYAYPGNEEFATFKESFQDIKELHALMECTHNLDQAQGLKTAMDVLLDKLSSSLILIQGGKGNGKSALLGLTVAYAAFFSFSNIFVTAPKRKDLHAFFQFLLQGLQAVGFVETHDFVAIRDKDDEDIIRVEVMKNHRIIIQYIHPEDTSKIGLTELMVIEEATSLPLSTLNSLLGDYITIITSSTDGCGSAGLLRHMELDQTFNDEIRMDAPFPKLQGRKATEISLNYSIAVQPNDHLKVWFNKLLHLKSENVVPMFSLPHYCSLYKVSKEVLFNGNPENEKFLQRMMTLYRASDYQMDPNDMRTIADSDDHQIFCLLPPITGDSIPEPLCVIHVFFGDLPPTLSNTQCHFKHQFKEVGALPKLWIIKIASNHNFQHSGYGKRALQLLEAFYNKGMHSKDELVNKNHLLLRLEQTLPEQAHFIGAAFELNPVLLRFFSKCGFKPVYISESWGKFSAAYPFVMVKKLREADDAQFTSLFSDFHETFIAQLSSLKSLPSPLALEVLESAACQENRPYLTQAILENWLSVDDLKCLELNVVAQMANYSIVSKYFTTLARLYFQYQIGRAVLYKEQKSILLGIGLQFKNLQELEKETNLSQVRALLNRLLRCLSTNLKKLLEQEVGKLIPEPEITRDVVEEVSKDLVQSKYQKYAINKDDAQWDKILAATKRDNIISIKSFFKRPAEHTAKDSNPPKKKRKRE